jgi:predicted transposase YbfD/YdcC
MGFCAASQITRIERERLHVKQGKDSHETVYAISSIPPLADVTQNAEQLLGVARNQWSIENGNHYVRDRSYDEDRCQVRHPNAAQILATLRSLSTFLARIQVHQPRSTRDRGVPALHRHCNAHRFDPIRWIHSHKKLPD